MADLKERVRNTQKSWRGQEHIGTAFADELLNAALAEIERLEQERDDAKKSAWKTEAKAARDIVALRADFATATQAHNAAVAENARLREKLRPFANDWNFLRPLVADQAAPCWSYLRAAAAELEEKDNG